MRAPWILAAVVVAAGVVYVSRTPPRAVAAADEPPAIRSGFSDTEVRELRARLARLERESDRNRDSRNAAAPSTTWSASAAPVDSALPVPTLEEGVDQDERTQALIESSMSAEPRDEAWATSVEREVAEHLRVRLGSGLRVNEVVCRSQTCALSLSTSDAVTLDRMMRGLSEEPLFAYGAYIRPANDAIGLPVTRVFFRRQGAPPFEWAAPGE